MICDICRFHVHRNCTLFTRTEYNDHMNAGTSDWTCQKCVESAFPFNHIIDDDVFHGCLHEFSCDHTLSASEYVQTKIFNPFNLNDDKDYIPCSDIDLDSCYYNRLSFSIQMNSNYYHVTFYVWDAVSTFNHLPRMFLSTDFAFWITDWACCHGPYLQAILRIISRGVSGLATDSPCGVCGRGWTTCLLHDSPLFGSHFKMRVGM